MSALIDDADWDDLIPRLLAYTRYRLSAYGELEGRRGARTTRSYVVGAVAAAVAKAGTAPRASTLFKQLGVTAAQLIEDDERNLREILDAVEWEDLIPRVIAHTVRRLGGGIGRNGKSPEDYVYDAVLQLLTRRRHYPVYRDVSLFTFLCKTVHGMRTNDLASLAAEGPHMTIAVEPPALGEVDASELADPSAAIVAEEFMTSLDPELERCARLRATGTHRTAEEYAEAVGFTTATIRNWDKRLRRRRGRWDARPR